MLFLKNVHLVTLSFKEGRLTDMESVRFHNFYVQENTNFIIISVRLLPTNLNCSIKFNKTAGTDIFSLL